MFGINTAHYMGCRILTWCITKTLHGKLSSFIGVFVMESCGSTIMGINRTSSIENEPRTLTMDQIQYAREAALYVLNTRSIEEAMSIFTEGLEPVVNACGKFGNIMMDSYLEDEDEMRSPRLRDIVSAPF